MPENQYVITAVYKDKGTATQWVRLVTSDPSAAQRFNISAYEGTDWNVYLEHFLVDRGRVVEQVSTHLIYPTVEGY